MVKKLQTIKLQNKDYATVPTRIKEFRQDCKKGVIETESKRNEMEIEFIATIYKDGSNREIGKAMGHSFGNIKDSKAFEKLETIAVGRALAMLGYMASGDVASSEEMDEFLSEKEVKRLNAVQVLKDKIDKIKSVAELRKFFTENKNHGLGKEVDDYMLEMSKLLKEAKREKNENN